jgi:hypothetical protein
MSQIARPPNKGMKQTKPSVLELRSLSPVLDGRVSWVLGRMDALREAPRAVANDAASELPPRGPVAL